MWRTSEGDRILRGAEAALFKAAVTDLVEDIKAEAATSHARWQSRIALFDDLLWSQKLAVLESVTMHLLTNAGPIPRLTAVNEAAVGVIYEHISYRVGVEIDDLPSRTQWRQLIVETCQECFCHSPDRATDVDTNNSQVWRPPLVTSTNQKRWHTTVQLLADRILWDRDYEMTGDFLDEPPEKAAILRQIMGIDDDYFASAAADLSSPDEVTAVLHRLKVILR